MTRRIAVVTGSRAEYGLLYWVLKDLHASEAFDLQLIVTGMHLSTEFGLTVRQIEADGLPIARRVEMLLASDSAGGIAKSMALGLIGFSDAIDDLQPELIVVLGDRFEILAVAEAALVHNVPLVHIGGGDTTEGAIDESIRHAITKMAHLHLVTNIEAARRIKQMGEDPMRVAIVGNPGLDHLRRTPLLDRTALEQSLGHPLGERNLLITFHPVTLEPEDARQQQQAMLQALDRLSRQTTLWFTRPNADAGGRELANDLDAWASTRPQAHVFTSLGQQRYLSLMSHADAVVGNSSSGLCEAPSFGIPTVNIGDRQRGRLAGASVIHCLPQTESIHTAIDEAMRMDCSDAINPYGDGQSTARILASLKSFRTDRDLLKKRFHDL
jgi:UDP-N-acetylglucosamine 2-epimerase (non-hydrolysing)/GDP/UDP-N,N'-diacetylbacillosamine 2-epimerase (hydrolysing)